MISKILDIEAEEKILSYRYEFEDMLIWPFIRHYVTQSMWDIEFNAPRNFYEHKVPRAKLWHYYTNIFKRNPLKKTTEEFDIINFTQGASNIYNNGVYENMVNDKFDLIKEFKVLTVESSHHHQFVTPRKNRDITNHDYILFMAKVKSKFSKNSVKDKKTIEKLLSYLRSKIQYKMSDSFWEELYGRCLYYSRTIRYLKPYYMKLIRSTKVIVLDNASFGGRSYITKWAKDEKKPVIEYQHGYINKIHQFYNIHPTVSASSEYLNYLPSYLLTYGKSWEEAITYPVECVTIGKPNLVKKSIAKNKRKLLLISSGKEFNTVIKFIMELLEMKFISQYDLYFRPHPVERNIVLSRYKEIFKNGVLLDKKANVYESIEESSLIIAEAGSVAYESFYFDVPVIVIDNKSVDGLDNKNLFRICKNAQDVQDSINSVLTIDEKVKNFIWEPNWENNYKVFMRNLLNKNKQ